MSRFGRGGPWCVGVVLGASVLGCKGSGGAAADGGANGDSLATAQGFCVQSNAVYAAIGPRCLGGTAADYGDADCAAYGTAKIQYDPAAAKTCLAMLQAAAATTCDPQPDCFGQVVTGLVPDGQQCTIDQECAVGSYCVSPDNTSCVPSVCTPPAPIGAPCLLFPGCVPEAICDGPPLMCVAATLGDVGEACGDRFTALCKDGLFCQVDAASTTGAGTCQPKPPPGAGCMADTDCDTAYEYCDKTCTPRIAVGQSCADHPTGCQFLATCDLVTARCKPAGHVGQPCSGVFGFCSGGVCDDTNPKGPVCVALKKVGAACANWYECESYVCQSSVCADCSR